MLPGTCIATGLQLDDLGKCLNLQNSPQRIPPAEGTYGVDLVRLAYNCSIWFSVNNQLNALKSHLSSMSPDIFQLKMVSNLFKTVKLSTLPAFQGMENSHNIRNGVVRMENVKDSSLRKNRNLSTLILSPKIVQRIQNKVRKVRGCGRKAKRIPKSMGDTNNELPQPKSETRNKQNDKLLI